MTYEEDIADDLVEFLPVDVAERAATALSESDVETLKFLYKQSIPENTLRALRSDLTYLERWHIAAMGQHLAWPASESVILKFIAHHLFNRDEHLKDPAHGMPDEVADRLIEEGACAKRPPHAPSTVRRRISSWKKLHDAKNFDHAFEERAVRVALKTAIKASPRVRKKKSQKPVTVEVLKTALKTLNLNSPRGRRDRALLLVAFGSGGRRRSEVSDLRIEDVSPAIPSVAPGVGRPAPIDVYDISLRRAKRISADDGEVIHVKGRAARALEDWVWILRRIRGEDLEGPLFRRFHRYGVIGDRAIDPGEVNNILKRCLAAAGLDASQYSAHGIRSGFLSEARNRGVPLEEAMRLTKHKSIQTAGEYYDLEDARRSRALTLLGR